MKVIKHDLAHAVASHTPSFVGDVATQGLVTEVDAANLRVTSVTFQDGARNRLHRHSCDQVLIITHGYGVVATEDEHIEVEAGDVILIPAGELHWHGARPGSDVTHISIVTPHETTFEEPAVAMTGAAHFSVAAAR